MRSIALGGVRGGVGCTSAAAGLGYALYALGQRVLLLDLARHNQLRLHFNLPLQIDGGWARTLLDANAWNGAAWALEARLCLVPYGELQDAEATVLAARVLYNPGLLRQPLGALEDRFDWLVVDCGHACEVAAALAPFDLRVTLVEPDPACAVLLARTHPDAAHWLVNRYDPRRGLQADLQVVWRRAPDHAFLPFSVHEDAAFAEALAMKMPVGHYAPDSQAARDLRDLADWCLAGGAPQP